MTLCPNCGGEAKPVYRTGGTDFWRCQTGTCLKMFQRPTNTVSGSANGKPCIEASGTIITKEKP